ncbi:MAG: hypothetical protein Q9222_003013 [Ikaeria aurantiellina]
MACILQLPNEILLSIFSYLSQRQIKAIRQVSKELAILGGHILINTVYISPRTEDIRVFRAITQHPDLRKSVVHLVYDTAQFTHLSQNEYYAKLHTQLRLQIQSGTSNPLLHGLFRVIQPEKIKADETLLDVNKRGRFDFWHDEGYEEGYQQWCEYAKEQSNVFSDPWFATVLGGLKRLGPIESVTLKSTFGVTFQQDRRGAAPYYYDSYAQGDSQYIHGPEDDKEVGPATTAFRGTSLTGSPVARKWLVTNLQPFTTDLKERYPRPSFSRESCGSSVSDGAVEFFKVAHLLSSAGQQPKVFEALGERFTTSGVPPFVLASSWFPESLHFKSVSSNLKVLRLHIASRTSKSGRTRSVVRIFPVLDVVTSVLEKAYMLEELHLSLPYIKTDGRPWANYDLDDIFPTTRAWSLPHLRKLLLRGFSASQQRVETLLYTSFPQLQDLCMLDARLTHGGRENIEFVVHHSQWQRGRPSQAHFGDLLINYGRIPLSEFMCSP